MKKTVRSNDERDEFVREVQATEIKDGSYRAEFTRIRRKRSLEANAYLWLILTIASDATGYDKTELYLFYLAKFPTFKTIEVGNEVLLTPISSSHFDSREMANLIENVRGALLRDLDIVTPEADSEKAVEIYNYYRERGLL